MGHLKQNNETYISHFIFAFKIGLTLVFRGFVFLLHAIFPTCDIYKKWNLASTISDLKTWLRHAIRRKNE